MKIDHIAIWTNNLEGLKDFYVRYFEGTAGNKYINEEKHFQSYFVTFDSGARIELMKKTGIPDNLNDRSGKQHTGIIHIAFGALSKAEVDKKAVTLREAGYKILSGPRVTGDGYYEFETLDPDDNRIEVTFPLGRDE